MSTREKIAVSLLLLAARIAAGSFSHSADFQGLYEQIRNAEAK